jgi:hypothetical protein
MNKYFGEKVELRLPVVSMSFAVGFCFMMTTFKLRELEAMDKAGGRTGADKASNGGSSSQKPKPKFLIHATEASSKTVPSETTAAPASVVVQQTLNDVV